MKVGTVCYGPVEDLGALVPVTWWKTVFSDALYLKTDGDVVEDADITKEEISLLRRIPEVLAILNQGIYFNNIDKPKVLDLCCGQGRHSLYILTCLQNLTVCGHDQSKYLIDLANERAAMLSETTTRPTFTVGDCRNIPYPDNTFDLVLLMGNSFGYFSEDEQDRAVLAEIHRALSPGGVLVLDLTDGDFMRENFAERSWEWADDTTFVCRERQLSKDGLRLNSREIITVTNKGVVRDQFYQERLYSRPEICKLLRSERFVERAETQEEAHVTLGEMSKRGEDLGMMANRMFITAVKSNMLIANLDNENSYNMNEHHNIIQNTHVKVQTPPFQQIVLILGDPSKPCIGKLNNTWNHEDIDTRKKLIKALIDGGVPSTALKIVENHDKLHEYLITNKPPFVFNLCDEGWNNDALKELHIPSLLEMLNIPYSGAGPNCLAFCYDKGLVNRSAEAIGIHTAKELTFLPDSSNYLLQIRKLSASVADKIGFPAFVKPIRGDNSLGINSRSIVKNCHELEDCMLQLDKSHIREVLLQEYLQGSEYGVGMIGNTETGFTFFPILEVDFSKIIDRKLPPILGYESKWDPESPYWTEIQYKKVFLSPEVDADLKKSCISLWNRFSCRDYARFDFRCDIGRGDGFDGLGGKIKLLEVNPNPGWGWDGKFAYMAKLGGYEYSDMLNMILAASWARLSAHHADII
jgi:D-alanine-D-alanine ligase